MRRCRAPSKGLLGQANHQSNEAEAIDSALDACRKVALSRGRFERIDEHGRAQQEPFADELVVSRKKNDPRVGEHQGFTLHAGVSFGALDRNGREKSVRYRTRPPLALQRLSVLRDGSIAYKLKYKVQVAWSNPSCDATDGADGEIGLVGGAARRRKRSAES